MLAYILRGAPASGKGTVAKEVIKKIQGKVAYLELDNFRWGFHLWNRKVFDISEDEHNLAYNNFLSVLENYCKNGNYNLVIEGLFSWNKRGVHGNMMDIIKILEKYHLDLKTFYLKADYKTLWKRNIKRKYSVPEKEFKTLFEYVGNGVSKKEIIVDVNNKTSEETIAEIKKYL